MCSFPGATQRSPRAPDERQRHPAPDQRHPMQDPHRQHRIPRDRLLFSDMAAFRTPGHGSPIHTAGAMCWGGRSPSTEGNHDNRHRRGWLRFSYTIGTGVQYKSILVAHAGRNEGKTLQQRRHMRGHIKMETHFSGVGFMAGGQVWFIGISLTLMSVGGEALMIMSDSPLGAMCARETFLSILVCQLEPWRGPLPNLGCVP